MFTGREYASKFAIYEYRARAYHPGLGRFLSEDPIGFNAGDYNLFRYCKNDPLDLTDPMGLFSPEAHDALFDHAFAGSIPKAEIQVMKDSSRKLDRSISSQLNPREAYKHSMRREWQTPKSAIKQREAFFKSQVTAAKEAAQHGNKNEALQRLGQAAHAIQDSHSPVHVNSKGEPRLWAPFRLTKLPENLLQHSPSDNRGHERTQDIPPEAYEKVAAALKDLYRQTFGN